MDTNESPEQKPVIIRQGGNGLALVLAAVILGGSGIVVANIWSNTQKTMIEAPSKALQNVIESGKGALKEAKGAIDGKP
ncbi:MAG: hypothetical protein AB8E74_05275 [Prochlorococcus sp.]|nr:hypothetical protein [Prochlorococcaceae cyanobacterium Fu_MAG_50]